MEARQGKEGAGNLRSQHDKRLRCEFREEGLSLSPSPSVDSFQFQSYAEKSEGGQMGKETGAYPLSD